MLLLKKQHLGRSRHSLGNWIFAWQSLSTFRPPKLTWLGTFGAYGSPHSRHVISEATIHAWYDITMSLLLHSSSLPHTSLDSVPTTKNGCPSSKLLLINNLKKGERMMAVCSTAANRLALVEISGDSPQLRCLTHHLCGIILSLWFLTASIFISGMSCNLQRCPNPLWHIQCKHHAGTFPALHDVTLPGWILGGSGAWFFKQRCLLILLMCLHTAILHNVTGFNDLMDDLAVGDGRMMVKRTWSMMLVLSVATTVSIPDGELEVEPTYNWTLFNFTFFVILTYPDHLVGHRTASNWQLCPAFLSSKSLPSILLVLLRLLTDGGGATHSAMIIQSSGFTHKKNSRNETIKINANNLRCALAWLIWFQSRYPIVQHCRQTIANLWGKLLCLESSACGLVSCLEWLRKSWNTVQNTGGWTGHTRLVSIESLIKSWWSVYFRLPAV